MTTAEDQHLSAQPVQREALPPEQTTDVTLDAMAQETKSEIQPTTLAESISVPSEAVPVQNNLPKTDVAKLTKPVHAVQNISLVEPEALTPQPKKPLLETTVDLIKTYISFDAIKRAIKKLKPHTKPNTLDTHAAEIYPVSTDTKPQQHSAPEDNILFGLDNEGTQTTGEILVDFTQKPNEEAHSQEPSEHVLRLVKKGDIVLDAQDVYREENQEEPIQREFTPITTTDELTKALDFITKLAPKKQLPEEDGKSSSYTVIVNEDVMTFLQTKKQDLEKTEQQDTNSIDDSDASESKQYITVSSAQKEIIIELKTLKGLLTLHKMRRLQHHGISFQQDVQSLEELGLHTMSTQNWDTSKSLWFVYQLLVFLFASTDENELSKNHQLPLFTSGPILHA